MCRLPPAVLSCYAPPATGPPQHCLVDVQRWLPRWVACRIFAACRESFLHILWAEGCYPAGAAGLFRSVAISFTNSNIRYNTTKVSLSTNGYLCLHLYLASASPRPHRVSEPATAEPQTFFSPIAGPPCHHSLHTHTLCQKFFSLLLRQGWVTSLRGPPCAAC